MRQDPGVQHVGIREHHVGALPDRLPGVLRGVAVVSEGADLGADLLDCAVELLELVLG